MRRAVRRLLPPAALLAVLALPGPARAERVFFQDMRSLEVSAIERQGEEYLLTMVSGSQVRVPAAFVTEVRESLPPPPDPDAAAPAAPLRTRNGAWRKLAGEYARQVRRAARRHSVEPELLVAVALVESRIDPLALSPKGALGVMQLMPSTAVLTGVKDPFDAKQNIDGGARWLRRMLDRFEGNLDFALAAYNAGPEAVKRYGGIPPYPETQRYVRLVREELARMRIPAPRG